MKKHIGHKLISLVCISLFMTLLSGCGKTNQAAKTIETGKDDFFVSNLESVIKSQSGTYHRNPEGFLYFFDTASEKDVIVCNKANCKHSSWNENTPAEEKCNAYTPSAAYLTGFVINKELYIFEPDLTDTGQSILLVRSNLHREEKQTVAKIKAQFIQSYAVKGECLYVTGNCGIKEEKDGIITTGIETASNLYKVNLKTGETTALLKDQLNYNGGMEVLSARENDIYLNYNFFEKEFDGTNFKEAIHHNEFYRYNIETGSYDRVFADFDDYYIYDAVSYNHNIFMMLRSSQKDNAGEEPTCILAKYDPDDDRLEKLKECSDGAFLLSDSAIYKEKGKDNYSYMKYENQKSRELKNLDLNADFIVDAGDYVYIQHNKDMTYSMMSKDDFYAGRKKEITIH